MATVVAPTVTIPPTTTPNTPRTATITVIPTLSPSVSMYLTAVATTIPNPTVVMTKAIAPIPYITPHPTMHTTKTVAITVTTIFEALAMIILIPVVPSNTIPTIPISTTTTPVVISDNRNDAPNMIMAVTPSTALLILTLICYYFH